MFTADVKKLIRDLRSHLCPRSQRDQAGLYDGIVFNLDLRLSCHKTDRHDWVFARVLFCGNTSVFVETRRTTLAPLLRGNLSDWRNTCNHDECWHTSGLDWVSATYFEMAERVNPGVAPAELSDTLTGFAMGEKPWELVRVGMKKDERDRNGYLRALTHLSIRK